MSHSHNRMSCCQKVKWEWVLYKYVKSIKVIKAKCIEKTAEISQQVKLKDADCNYNTRWMTLNLILNSSTTSQI